MELERERERERELEREQELERERERELEQEQEQELEQELEQERELEREREQELEQERERERMTDLITTGTLTEAMPQRETLVANQITAYLEQEHKTINDVVLADMLKAFERSMTRQIMSPRMDRKGYESTTTYTHPCPRKSRYQFDGVKGEPIQARSMLKFMLGDLVELAVIGIAQLAGVNITDNNRDLYITGRDGARISVHPDGMVRDSQGTPWNFECKSCDSRTFDKWLEQGGPDNTWGYLDQTAVEYWAWCESTGIQPQGTVFVAVSTGSRQGSIAEWKIPFDEKLLNAWHERRALARAKDMPTIPFDLEIERDYMAGKSCNADWFMHGDPIPRVNAKGHIYGWDAPTGRKILPMICSYCSYKGACYPFAEMDVKSGKPVWVVPANAGAFVKE